MREREKGNCEKDALYWSKEEDVYL